jgi:Mlc titration factor MtfA (ptsG expression regulator)
MGYRCFDQVLDNSYDTIVDNTERFRAVTALIDWISQQDPVEFYARCRADVEHNQALFRSRHTDRLAALDQHLRATLPESVQPGP